MRCRQCRQPAKGKGVNLLSTMHEAVRPPLARRYSPLSCMNCIQPLHQLQRWEHKSDRQTLPPAHAAAHLVAACSRRRCCCLQPLLPFSFIHSPIKFPLHRLCDALGKLCTGVIRHLQ